MNNSAQPEVTKVNSAGPPFGVFIEGRRYGPELVLSNLLSKAKSYMKFTPPGSHELLENKELHAACHVFIKSGGKETTTGMPLELLSRRLSYRIECSKMIERMIEILNLPKPEKCRFQTKRAEGEPEFKGYFREGGMISKEGGKIYFSLPSFEGFIDEANIGMLTEKDLARLRELKKMLRGWDVLEPIAMDKYSKWRKTRDYFAFIFLAAKRDPTEEAEKTWCSLGCIGHSF